MNQLTRQLSFDTHGYPQGMGQAQILIPVSCIRLPVQDVEIEVLVDGQSVVSKLEHEAGGPGTAPGWKITFQFPQGEHSVVVTAH